MSTRRYLPVLTTLCLALVGLLSVGVGSAFAAAPSVTVSTPSGMTGTTVDVTGTVNPNGVPGAAATDWGIQYARVSEPGVWNATVFGGEFAGAEAELKTPQPVGGTIEGLEPDTAYVVRVFAINGALEEANPMPEKPFSTLALAPSVDSESTSAVSSSAATLEALVNPNNQDTKGYLQYSTSAAVNGSGSLVSATQVPASPGTDLGSAFGDQLLGPAALTGLPAGSTYYYQAVAANTTGTTYGVVQPVTTVPTPNTDAPTVVAAATATFNGHLTLEAVDTQYSFSYNVGGECTGGSSTPAADAGTGAGNAPQATDVTGLLPHTQYTVCFVTSNAFGSEQGPPVSFATPVGLPTIESESVANVSGDSATLEAEVDPNGGETTYHFEYGTNTSYSQNTPESPSIGENDTGHLATAHIQGLEAGTIYHYRIVVTNALGPVAGSDATFTAQPVEGEFTLPDGREYEMVSPPQKEGSEVILAASQEGGLDQGGESSAASVDGTKVAYLASLPFANPTAAGHDVQILSTRGPEGWSSQDISPPHEKPGLLSAIVPEFSAFSSDLSLAEVDPIGYTNLSAVSRQGYWISFLRDNLDGSYEPLLTEAPEAAKISNEGGGFNMRFAGANPDLSHIVFQSASALTSNAIATEYNWANLYEWTGGHFQLISVLPGQSSGDGGAFIGISDDGTQVLWADPNSELYVRDLATETTIDLGPAKNPEEAMITKDGSKVFFVGGASRQLQVTDLNSTTPTSTQIGNGSNEVEEVLGASADGSYVYYMDTLESGGNIYVAHDEDGAWTTKLISSGGVQRGELGGHRPHFRSSNRGAAMATVTANGEYFAYGSYETSKVYFYDAGSDRLICASCDPTGETPPGGSTFEFMSEAGRIFFDSSSALVAQDTNGAQDVYEWEPAGIGGCQSSPGCMYLISNGTSDDSSSFLGAGADGDDVFFMTRARLAPQDFDNSFDTYDAHVCTTIEPCAASPVSPPACTSSDACKAAPMPQPGVFGAPPSATFSGAGNVVVSTTATAVKTKAKAKVKPKHRRKHDKRHAGKKKSRKSKSKQARAGKSLSAGSRR